MWLLILCITVVTLCIYGVQQAIGWLGVGVISGVLALWASLVWAVKESK
jgi:hypothetical protein